MSAIPINTHDQDDANAYFSPKLANKFLMRYMSLLPLWSCIALPMDQKRLSNGVVESWFNIVKTHSLHGKPANTIADFERSIRPSALGCLKENINLLTRTETNVSEVS